MPKTPARLPLAKVSHRRFQFGTRGLLLLVAAAAILFAVVKILSVLMTLVVAFGALLVALHIFGNAWGTRLRQHESPDVDDSRIQGHVPRAAQFEPPVSAPITALNASTKLGWVMVAVTVFGAIIGAAIGAALLMMFEKGLPWPALLVGAGSAAVLGGFAGFMASSLVEVGLRAWWEAVSWETPVALRPMLAWRIASYALLIAGLIGTIACGSTLRSRAVIAAAEDAGEFANMSPAVDWSLRIGLIVSVICIVASMTILWAVSRGPRD